MTDEEFWNIVDFVDRDAINREDINGSLERFIPALSSSGREEIIEFHRILCEKLFALDTKLHHQNSGINKTDDGFLYARCYVVGMGRERYLEALSDPKKMPQKAVTFEHILSAAEYAFAELGLSYEEIDQEQFQSFESGSNRIEWGYEPGKILAIGFQDTRELIFQMIETDRSERAAIGGDQSELMALFAKNLNRLNFKSHSCEELCIKLLPGEVHGNLSDVKMISAKFAQATAIVNPRVYISLSKKARNIFFIDLAVEVLKQVSSAKTSDTSTFEEAKLAVLESVV